MLWNLRLTILIGAVVLFTNNHSLGGTERYTVQAGNAADATAGAWQPPHCSYSTCTGAGISSQITRRSPPAADR